MAKKKVSRKVTKVIKNLSIINAHAGEYGAKKGTFATYSKDGDVHFAFFPWALGTGPIVITVDMRRKLDNLKPPTKVVRTNNN